MYDMWPFGSMTDGGTLFTCDFLELGYNFVAKSQKGQFTNFKPGDAK